MKLEHDGLGSFGTLSANAVEGGGRLRDDALCTHAPATPSASNGGAAGHCTNDARVSNARSDLIDAVQATYRMRVRWMNAERSLTLQAKAFCRSLCGGDKTEAAALYDAALDLISPPKRRTPHAHPMAETAMFAILPLVQARDIVATHKAEAEKTLLSLTDQFPADVLALCDATPGFARGSLAAIIGEAGDLAKYATPAKLWKTMGLAVRQDDERGSIAAKRILEDHYPARRRALMHVIATGLAMNGKGCGSVWYGYITDRKAYAATKVDHEGKPWSAMRALRYAQRWTVKRLLRELWRAWRAEGAGLDLDGTHCRDARPN